MAKDSEMNEIIIVIIAIIVIGAIIIFIFRNRIRNFGGVEPEMDGIEFQDRRFQDRRFQDKKHIIDGAGRHIIIGGAGKRAGGVQKVQIYS